jgi:hypothetical protein
MKTQKRNETINMIGNKDEKLKKGIHLKKGLLAIEGHLIMI